MSFLFKKKDNSVNGDELMQQTQQSQPQQPQQPRILTSSPPMQQLSTHGAEHHVSAALSSSSSSFTGPTPMSTSPLTTSTSPIAREAPNLLTNHFAAPPTASASQQQQQQQQQPQQMAYSLQSIPPFAGHAASASSVSSSSSLPPMSDQSAGGQPLSASSSSAVLPAASSSAASSASSSTSFSAFSSPPSPSSRESSSSVDLTPFPVLEEKPSDDAIILRAHFSSIHNMSRQLFTIGDTLGTGTFGRVRLVSYHHPPLSAKTLHFALKMLKKSEIIRLKQVEHIKAEKSILSRICHPFIVNLFSHFQDDRYLYMLMEYVIGGELFSQLRKVGRFSNDTARFYAAEIVLALQYLHSKDIVYRDLKPENLLIDREGHIKITDFGFAKVVEDRTWTLCGTPEYLAPEIIQSKGHGKAVDWWALGILVYEMIAGYPPFYDENPFGIYQKILAGRIDFPKHFDPYAKDLVKKLLTADRSKRFGCLKDGADDVKRHRWFKGVDWTRVHQRRVKPPYVPGFASSDDTSNFDKYPDSEGEEGGGVALNAKEKEQFLDF